MPDDTNEGIAEQEELDLGDDEALKSFLEDDDDDESEGAETDVGDQEKPVDEKKSKPPAKKEDDDDAKPDYSEELSKRLDAELAPGKKKADKEPDVKEKEEPPKAEQKKPAEEDSFYGLLLDDVEIPAKEIKIGDYTINLKEYKQDYPEDYAAVVALSSAITKKNIEHLLKTGEIVHAKDLANIKGQAEDLANIKGQIKDIEFWGQIKESHPDAVKINKDPEFIKWLSNQEEPLKYLARNMESPEDGILILDFYKKSVGKTKAKGYDNALKTKKKSHDDLHKGSMRQQRTVSKTNDVNMDDAEAAFNEPDEDEY